MNSFIQSVHDTLTNIPFTVVYATTGALVVSGLVYHFGKPSPPENVYFEDTDKRPPGSMLPRTYINSDDTRTVILGGQIYCEPLSSPVTFYGFYPALISRPREARSAEDAQALARIQTIYDDINLVMFDTVCKCMEESNAVRGGAHQARERFYSALPSVLQDLDSQMEKEGYCVIASTPDQAEESTGDGQSVSTESGEGDREDSIWFLRKVDWWKKEPRMRPFIR